MPFSVEHHALLIGWINREVIHRFGNDEGVKTVLEATQRYALQRGRRMAMRVTAHGRKLTGLNYLCYGEWTTERGKMKTKIIDRSPKLKVHAVKCPWDSFWREHNLLEFGKYFCQVADSALYQGYNPLLNLDVNGTRTNGDPYCEFVFHDISVTWKKLLAFILRKTLLTKKVVMPWEYHTGHIFKTFAETISAAFGKEGEEMMSNVLSEFEGYFGHEAKMIVEQYQTTDFDVLST